MEEEKMQDDFWTYKERNFPHFTQRPTFHIYVLLTISSLLTAVFFIVALSKATVLSSELSELDAEIPKPKSGHDFYLFPCGPDTRQWEYFNGKCYYFSLEKTSWMRAKDQCNYRNSKLVVVDSMAEQNFLQTRTRNDRYWMGLNDRDMEGQWQWIDGSNYNEGFMYWKPGEPNNDQSNEHCAHLWSSGEWNDVYCTYLCYYVCEKPLLGARPAHERGTFSLNFTDAQRY
ncbi:hepatic lectin-like [Rhineura floridana]|uniref:hepatic lectin-like n=1 Tax=Rhineura floridana TaxID=261503 RepID=UPI002AC858E4|nr:hepatic lectin-like [Rhineura floridana]